MLKRIKKLVLRSLIYLSLLIAVGYSFFVWQAKQGIDAFILSYPLGGEFEYEWIFVDLDGNISLYNIALYRQSNDPIFRADLLRIKSGSLLDLTDLKENIVFREYSEKIAINLENGSSSQTAKMASLFGISYQPQMISYLYPESCHPVLAGDLPSINFNLVINFAIQQTADVNTVKVRFDSKELTQIEASFDINNFTQSGNDGAYITDLSVQLHELFWLQQNTQKCLSKINVSQSEFSALLIPHMQKLAKSKQLLLSNEAATFISNFIFVPQTVGAEFKIKQGKTLDQIPFYPVYNYQKQTGLNLTLNLMPLGQLFSQHIAPVAIDSTTNTTLKSTQFNEIYKPVFLSISRNALSSRLGAKLKLLLKNNTEIVGYLEGVEQTRIRIRQLKYKGESIFPFELNEIKSILLIRNN